MKQREPRRHDRKYLDWLKTRRCDACGGPPPCDPAHLKSGNLALDKPSSGTAKPDDKWASSLCRGCHDRQHNRGDELAFWRGIGIDPFLLCMRLYAEYGGTGGIVRKQRSVKPRLPKDKRTRIISRPNAWPKGRGFGK